MLSQKLRNYFHHVVNLETCSPHNVRLDFEKHDDMVAHIKRKSPYTTLYRSHLSHTKDMLIDFKWNVDLAMMYTKGSYFEEYQYFDIDEFQSLENYVRNEVNNLPEPTLSEEQKVLRLIDYHKKLLSFPLNQGYVKEQTERHIQAYENWRSTNFDKPDMSY